MTAKTHDDVWLAESGPSGAGCSSAMLGAIVSAIGLIVGIGWAWNTLPANEAQFVAVGLVIVLVVLPLWVSLGLRHSGSLWRVRYLGSHLAVTEDGLTITSRRRTEWLAWSDMTGVELRPMDAKLASGLGIRRINRMMAVGRGATLSGWAPIQRIGDFAPERGRPTQIYLDPGIFVPLDHNTAIGRCFWRFRPDIAEALGFRRPEGDPPTRRHTKEPDSDVDELLLCRGSDDGSAVDVVGIGRLTVAMNRDRSLVEISGESVPTIRIRRRGGRTTALVPIGTTKLSALKTTVGGEPIEIVLLKRNPFSYFEARYIATDGRGALFLLEAETKFLVSSAMRVSVGGLIVTERPLMVRRSIGGRIDVAIAEHTSGEVAPGEVALAVGLAAAFGTRTVRLWGLPLTLIYAWTYHHGRTSESGWPRTGVLNASDDVSQRTD